MKKVNIHEAKTQFFKLVEQAAEGEEIVIAKSGKLLFWFPILQSANPACPDTCAARSASKRTLIGLNRKIYSGRSKASPNSSVTPLYPCPALVRITKRRMTSHDLKELTEFPLTWRGAVVNVG